jgi:hypothetical protein
LFLSRVSLRIINFASYGVLRTSLASLVVVTTNFIVKVEGEGERRREEERVERKV